MMTSCTSTTTFNKLMYQVAGNTVTDAGNNLNENQSEISSADSYWSGNGDLRTIAAQLGVANPEDLFTERFRVDRQKLEAMIRTPTQTEDVNSAEEFFQAIMKDTSTYIGWPHKLKVGAKTKKDPHVRIVGRMEDVVTAKEQVLSTLDSKGTRVIMKMDVSYTDHSYIIGRYGNNIKRIMDDTKTHIHFPDSNRSNPTEKSNQVSLCGSLEGVERARSLVRGSTPLIISFELPITAPGHTVPDKDTPYVKEIETNYNVQVTFSNRPKLHSSLVLVKGAEKEAERVQTATQLLINYMCNECASMMHVQMQLEVSTQHHGIVKGPRSCNLLGIMGRTKTKIMFPDVNDSNIKTIKKSQVTITGTIENVYSARQQLIGNLPITLIFDYQETNIDSSEIAEINNRYGVLINIKQKCKFGPMGIIIKGVEKFIGKIYEARHELLKLPTPMVIPEIPESYFSPNDLDNEMAFKKALTNILTLSNADQPVTPNFPSSPNYAAAALGAISKYPKFNLTPPGLPSYPMNQQNRLQPPSHHQQQQQQQQQQQHQTIQRNSQSQAFGFSGPSTVAGTSSGMQKLSPRSQNTSGYQSLGGSTTSLDQLYPMYNHPVSGRTSSTGHSPESGRFSANSNQLEQQSQHLGDATGSQFSAINQSPSTSYSEKSNTYEFDMKRIDGYKAMDCPPNPNELRTPTGNWVGLGMSKTSPVPPIDSINNERLMTWNEHRESVMARANASPYRMGATTGVAEASTSQRRNQQLSQPTDIYTLLTKLGLEHYIKTFVVNEIDMDVFSSLTDENLVDMGIRAFGARKKLLMAIQTMAAARNMQNNANIGTKTNQTDTPYSPTTMGKFSGSAAPGAERRSSFGYN